MVVLGVVVGGGRLGVSAGGNSIVLGHVQVEVVGRWTWRGAGGWSLQGRLFQSLGGAGGEGVQPFEVCGGAGGVSQSPVPFRETHGGQRPLGAWGGGSVVLLWREREE